MLFDPSLTYVNSVSHEDREEIAKVVLNEQTRRILKVVNIVTNIIVPAAVCMGTNCNLLAAFGSFVATDIILNIVDYYLIVIKPHQMLRDSVLTDAKKNLREFISRRDDLTSKIDLFDSGKKEKEWTDSDYESWQKEKEALDVFIECESDWIDKKLTPYKEDEIKYLQRPVKDYSEKRQFFVDFNEQIKMYINMYDLACLKPINSAVSSLISTLDLRNDGYELIPQMIYVYINELQKILIKIKQLNKSQMKEHLQDLIKVSNALSKNIIALVEKINNADSAEIDLGLSVLIQELEKELV